MKPYSSHNQMLTFAFLGTNLVHIDDVVRGDKCGCICPSCHASLRANHGSIKQHYFSHLAGEQCDTAIESALHFAAKTILKPKEELTLPALDTTTSVITDLNLIPHQKSEPVIHRETKFIIDEVKVEESLNNFRPDIILSISKKELLVEIAVTHFIDAKKREKIVDRNISCVEINLSKLSRGASWSDIHRAVTSGQNTNWVHNKKEIHIKANLEKKLALEVQLRNNIIKKNRIKTRKYLALKNSRNKLHLAMKKSIQQKRITVTKLLEAANWKLEQKKNKTLREQKLRAAKRLHTTQSMELKKLLIHTGYFENLKTTN